MKQTPGHQSVSEIGGRFVIRLLRILIGSIAKIFADERDSVENDRYHDRGKNRQEYAQGFFKSANTRVEP